MLDHGKTSKRKFKAEVVQLLDILARSLYTNKEIFIRELLSNASDALEKMRFEMERNRDVIDENLPLEIRITCDPDTRSLIISDTGIGMNDEEIIANLGTIAKSGSSEFIAQFSESDNEDVSSLIGKFGVGFYSVFMAAERVIVESRSYRPDERAVSWISSGSGSYEVTATEDPQVRGTRIRVELKEDDHRFSDPKIVKNIVKTHSNFLTYPVYINDEKANTIAALWKKSRKDITKDQYAEFYKFISHDTNDPFETIHISVDAPIQFDSIIFIPSKTDKFFNMQRKIPGLDLYARRILIQHGYEGLIPEWLGFLRGMVDSEDLPLNISRETLQENRVIGKIRQTIERHLLSELSKMADQDPERYRTFWTEFGSHLKLGVQDFANRDKVIPLLRFNHSHHETQNELISLDEYIDGMPGDQKEIYYAFGSSREALIRKPHLEMFTKKGIDVLFLYEPMDEFILNTIGSYKDHPLRSVEHADPASLESIETQESTDEKPSDEEIDEKGFGDFLARIKNILGDRITEARISKRLAESPCCLVNPEGELTSSMQRIMQVVSQETVIPKRILEINPDNSFIKNLLSIHEKDPTDPFLLHAVELMYDGALVEEGFMTEPHTLNERIQAVLFDAAQIHGRSSD